MGFYVDNNNVYSSISKNNKGPCTTSMQWFDKDRKYYRIKHR